MSSERPLNFRCWDTEESKWTDFECFVGPQYLGLHEKFDNIIVTQDTGLKDRNGNPIFEGDIIDYKMGVPCLLICKWNFLHGAWVFRIRDDEISFHYYHHELNGDAEIKGNIFENPELIHIKKP